MNDNETSSSKIKEKSKSHFIIYLQISKKLLT